MEESTHSRFSYARVTASGSEYFRIWMVNLLLIVVTLGFYIPFAKARRLRYFYANTLVDGQPLAFHGNPWTMFRGYLLMWLLFASYALTSWIWPAAAFAWLVLLAVLWPALWRSSMIFRLSNTSWRGLRLGFAGGLWRAYAWVPSALLGLGLLAACVMTYGRAVADIQRLYALTGGYGVDIADFLPLWRPLVLLGGAVALLSGALWQMKQYQHGGYRIAQELGELRAPRSTFLALGFKLLVWGILLQLLLGALMAYMIPKVVASAQRGDLALSVLGWSMVGVLLMGFSIVMNASVQAWIQNQSWSHTGSAHIRFFSNLSAMELSALSLQNTLLVVLTAGLYRPFAVVQTVRMRLEAVRVEFLGDTDRWQATPLTAQPAATGEMAGDFFGFDVGL